MTGFCSPFQVNAIPDENLNPKHVFLASEIYKELTDGYEAMSVHALVRVMHGLIAARMGPWLFYYSRYSFLRCYLVLVRDTRLNLGDTSESFVKTYLAYTLLNSIRYGRSLLNLEDAHSVFILRRPRILVVGLHESFRTFVGQAYASVRSC